MMIQIQKLILLIFSVFLTPGEHTANEPEVIKPVFEVSDSYQTFVEMELEELISYDIFDKAYTGFRKIEEKNKEILTLIDFSKPSTEERLYVLDLEEKEVLFKTYVTHGKNSGEKYATSFSNKNGSYQSSLGFYLTDQTYYGKAGYSLRLDGLEKGINDMARQRAIVVHGTKNAEPSIIRKLGRLGRSLGCPALPQSLTKPIINTIKDGSVIFIYAEDENYLAQSTVLSDMNNVMATDFGDYV